MIPLRIYVPCGRSREAAAHEEDKFLQLAELQRGRGKRLYIRQPPENAGRGAGESLHTEIEKDMRQQVSLNKYY
jgi:hypothetical protein